MVQLRYEWLWESKHLKWKGRRRSGEARSVSSQRQRKTADTVVLLKRIAICMERYPIIPSPWLSQNQYIDCYCVNKKSLYKSYIFSLHNRNGKKIYILLTKQTQTAVVYQWFSLAVYDCLFPFLSMKRRLKVGRLRSQLFAHFDV